MKQIKTCENCNYIRFKATHYPCNKCNKNKALTIQNKWEKAK